MWECFSVVQAGTAILIAWLVVTSQKKSGAYKVLRLYCVIAEGVLDRLKSEAQPDDLGFLKDDVYH